MLVCVLQVAQANPHTRHNLNSKICERNENRVREGFDDECQQTLDDVAVVC